jgi:hypothetical protein
MSNSNGRIHPEPRGLVSETRVTINMLRTLAAKLELYTNLLEAEVERQRPTEGGRNGR